MTLEYWREYRTYFHIGQAWGVNESTADRIVKKIEDLLVSRAFTLPGKKKLQKSDYQLEVVVDVTETPRLATQKTQKQFYSGKKKRDTLKSQVIVNQGTKEIICTAHAKGKEHDFHIFKTSNRLNKDIKILAEQGYQGIQKLHGLSQTPKKKPRKSHLSISDKKSNLQLARIRVVGENIHCKLKVFKILSERYRNRRKRFGLRFNLIAGLYNYELRFPKCLAA